MLTLDRHGLMASAPGPPCEEHEIPSARGPDTPLLYWAKNPFGVTGYVLRNSALSKLVDSNLHLEMLAIDTLLQSLGGVAQKQAGQETSPIATYISKHGQLEVVGLHHNHSASEALCSPVQSQPSMAVLLAVATSSSVNPPPGA